MSNVKGDEEASRSQVSSRSRQRTLTEKGKAYALDLLIAKCKTLSTQLTTKSNAVRPLFEKYENLNAVNDILSDWNAIYDSFVNAYNEYCLQTSEETIDPNNVTWFETNDK